MFSQKKSSSKLEPDQRELYENARRRTKQKKRLFLHFVVFLVGAVLLIVLNVVIGFREEFMPLGYNWFVWAILLWTFFFLIHVVNVFITSSFMGKEWEKRQMDKLVEKQRNKIEELNKKVQKQHPLPPKDSGYSPAPERRLGDDRNLRDLD
jgi:ABC-type multidrug transport system fused ATPase/permease subunit